MKYTIKSALLCLCVAASGHAFAKSSISDDKFRQLEENLPTPNIYRTASGAPGHKYWQQEVDYKIDITLNDEKQTLSGSETIDYTNNSPDNLRYLWLQLDQNKLAENSGAKTTRTAPKKKQLLEDYETLSKLTHLTVAITLLKLLAQTVKL